MFETNSWVDADYRKAIEHLQAGQLAEAELLLRAVLAMEPNYSPCWFALGTVLMRSGNYAGACDCFDNALAVQPDKVEAWINRAGVLRALGRTDDAIADLERADTIQPDMPAVQEMLASIYLETGRLDQAERAAGRGAEIAPESPRFPYLLGYLHRKALRLDQAAASYLAAVGKDPDFADAWADLGTVRQAQQQPQEAEKSYRRALELAPKHVLASLNLAQLLMTQGRTAESRPIVDGLIESGTAVADAWRLAAELARIEGRIAQSVAHYEKLLELRPGDPDGFYGLGLALQASGRFAEATDALQRATQAAPGFAVAWATLAGLLLMSGEIEQSIASYKQAAAIEPNQSAWQEALGWIELDAGDPASALSRFETAAELTPNDPFAESRVLYCLPFQSDPDVKDLAKRMQSWGKKVAAKRPLSAGNVAAADARPLAVAYLLPNMTNHPTGPFVQALLAAHDRNAVDAIGYTMTPESRALPSALAANVTRWRFILGADAEKIAEQIQRDGVDILVDISGHRPGHRLDVMALGAAPIQLSWPIGNGLATGLPNIDGVIADSTLIPPATAKLFNEDVLRPWPIYACYRPHEAAPEPQAMDVSQPITFGYVGRMARLNPRVVAAWSAILREVPTARLLLDHGSLRGAGAQGAIRQRFAAEGIAEERILAQYSVPVWSAWQQIDIALDPFPSSAGATLLEGLSMGRPAVTLASEIPSGRFGAAILPHVGLADWVTKSEENYVARAVAAASDRALLTELRTSLRARLLASPLCDAAGFARALEAEYRRLHDAKRAPKG